MSKLLLFLLLILFNIIFFVETSFAEMPQINSKLVTEDSIGFMKLGMPLKDVREILNKLKYKVSEKDKTYIIYDKNGIPIITFNVFLDKKKGYPVRSIKTTSNKFYLDSEIPLVGSTVGKIAAIYPEVSIFRVSPSTDSPEIIDFKGWPFSESKPVGKYIVKYKTVLNKISDEYGNTAPVGLYSTKFALYTDKYTPEAKIESFQIEAIEPKVKFN